MDDGYYDDAAEAGGSGAELPGDGGWSDGAAYRLNGESFDKEGNKIKRKDRRDNASSGLRSNEESAVNEEGGEPKSGLAGVRDKEKADGFTSNVVGRSSKGNDKNKGGFKGLLKGKGPLGIIIAVIFGGGVAFGGMNAFLPFSLIAQFTETFNSMHTSVDLRTEKMLNYQMAAGDIKYPIKANLFGKETFRSLSSKQQTKLAAQGIEYDNDYNGTGTRVLKFDDGSGNIKIVTADADTAVKLGDGAVDFRTLYMGDSNFFNGYNKASMTWRGAISHWFGTLTVKFLQSNKITRNMFKDFQQRVTDTEGGNADFVAKQIIAKGAEDVENGGMQVKGVETEEVKDEQGKPKTVVKYEEDDPSKPITTTDNAGGGAIKSSQLRKYETAKAKIDSIGGTVQKGANIACTLMNVAGAVSMLVTASEAIQIINLVSGYFEAIDKVKAGQGSDSPINELINALVVPYEEENAVIENSGVSVDYNNIDNNFVDIGDGNKTIKTLEAKTETRKKSAMESSGISSFYGGGKVNPDDPSVRSFNLTGSFKRIFGGIGVSMTAFTACAVTKIASNVTTAVISLLDIAACVAGIIGAPFTFGGSTVGCSLVIKDLVKGIAKGIAIGVAVAGLISIITPIATKALTRDLISDLGGESLGNALTYGANIYMGNTHRANGGSLGNMEAAIAYFAEQQKVIAENAKYERNTKSPFDATSKYTFIGALFTDMMSFVRARSLPSLITSAGSTLSSSIVAMSPTVSAVSIADLLPDSMEEYEKTCPYLASIDAVGDAFCNPYAITDVTTMDYDPIEIIKTLKEGGNLVTDSSGELETVVVGKDDDGDITNVKIKADSRLAKYILFCDERTSAFGLADNNIVNQVTSWGSVSTQSSFVNSFANSAIGAVPVIGDSIDVVSNTIGLSHIGYVGGASCVAGNKVDTTLRTDSSNWEEAKVYQRFVEDQSWAETSGLIEKSAVTAFLEDYYEKNPLDNSYEGMLARYSGMTKDTVIALLDVIEYGNYLANYHPEERYYFGEPQIENDEIKFDNENTLATSVMMPLERIIYADVRNRNFVV